MARPLVAPTVLLALGACMHNTPVQSTPESEMFGPLEARVHVSSFGGMAMTVDLTRPAYVAVFEVVPGSGTAILYPRLGQPSFLQAGRNYPHVLAGSLFRNAAGSAYDWAARDVSGWRSSSRSWMQPRHIFLVASEVPLTTEGLGIWSSRGAGVLTHPAFASFSAQATMGHLLDAVLPSQPGAQWTTDVYTIWPEPPPSPDSWRSARTRVPVWLSCGGNAVHYAAGTPLDVIRAQLQAGCRIVQAPASSDSVATSKPAPDTTAAPASGTKTPPTVPRDPKAEPVRPVLPGAARLNRVARGDELDDEQPARDALFRAIVRAGGRAYRPGDLASDRERPGIGENDDQRWQAPARRGGAGPVARSPRPLPAGTGDTRAAPAAERTSGEITRPREQARVTPSRPRPAERARIEPTRTREQPTPARERPSASERRRPQADPPRQAAPVQRSKPPAAAPARTSAKPEARPTVPPKKADPPERPPREVPPA